MECIDFSMDHARVCEGFKNLVVSSNIFQDVDLFKLDMELSMLPLSNVYKSIVKSPFLNKFE